MHDEVLESSLQTKAQIPAIGFTAELPVTDGRLVAAVLAGDEEAFAEIFEKYKRQVAKVVGRFFREQSDIEEFVQQSFTRAYFSLKKFHGDNDNSFPAWITRIAINVCYDEFRRRRRNGYDAFSNISEEENDYLAKLADGRAVSPEDSVIAVQLAEKLLDSLSPDDRVALTLVYSEEYSLDEAAGAIGISTGSLKSRLFRCRSQLKMRFGYLFK